MVNLIETGLNHLGRNMQCFVFLYKKRYIIYLLYIAANFRCVVDAADDTIGHARLVYDQMMSNTARDQTVCQNKI